VTTTCTTWLTSTHVGSLSSTSNATYMPNEREGVTPPFRCLVRRSAP
jgi:hypothetical protein